MSTDAFTVFVSYSHQDETWLQRLRVHLKALQLEGLKVDCWDDLRIKPGGAWREEIRNAIDDADIAVLLVSADFLASDFITKDELPPLLEGSASKQTLILPVILKPCRFSEHPQLSRFQAINDPNQPLIDLSEGQREKVYLQVADAIAKRIRLDELDREYWKLTGEMAKALRKVLDDPHLSASEKNKRITNILQSFGERDRERCAEMVKLTEGEEYALEALHRAEAFCDTIRDREHK